MTKKPNTFIALEINGTRRHSPALDPEGAPIPAVGDELHIPVMEQGTLNYPVVGLRVVGRKYIGRKDGSYTITVQCEEMG